MARLPLIVGFGGVNAAGRSSFHHGYRRLVIDALAGSQVESTYASLAALMGCDADAHEQMRAHTLIRRIEPAWFDVNAVPHNRRFTVEESGQPLQFETRARALPETLPPNWRVTPLAGGQVRVEVSGSSEWLLPTTDSFPVQAAGQLPSGFAPGALYQSRHHPRALEMAIFAASDALGSLGADWEAICQRVAPDQISCYAGSALSQLDENSYGGLLGARTRGRRVTSKQLPFGMPDMTADFVNAYVLGNVGSTGVNAGACASFLYSLRAAVDDIRSGRARVAVVGGSEAPVVPEVMEGFAAMGALCTDKELLQLDAARGLTEPDYRRACRPFSSNAGFTIAEAAHYVVLMDDELALELGMSIYGAALDVFINADGYKKSISSPGVGNYLTVVKAVAAARGLLGDESVQRRSYIHAHGTGTPQNRQTESQIFSETAALFGIESWPVAAIKAYLGHSMGVAPADQLVATLGTWSDGIIPGITTIDHIAEDVHRERLLFSMEHLEVGSEGMDSAVLNAKGFGGNNASATVLAPHIARRMLAKRHGSKAMTAWQQRNEAVTAAAADYDAAASAGEWRIIYRFDHNVLSGEDLAASTQGIRVPGFGQPIDLEVESPYRDWL